MTSAVIPEIQPPPAIDRTALRFGLEATRARFHALLDAVPEERWLRKSPSSAWVVREVFEHLTWSLEQLPREVESARRGKGMFNMPKFVADPGSYWLTRWNSRNATRQSIKRRYDAAMDATIRALEGIKDSEWSLGANFYGEGFHTIADLFRTPAHHLEEHTQGI